jgi:hypothetical protein
MKLGDFTVSEGHGYPLGNMSVYPSVITFFYLLSV